MGERLTVQFARGTRREATNISSLVAATSASARTKRTILTDSGYALASKVEAL